MKARLQLVFAVAILVLWLFVCFEATRNSELIGLATVITPVILLPAGWLFTDGYLRARRRDRTLERGEDEDAQS